ncbi:MAG: methenyltetrahydrofolate cyclohydrolase [Anaerolineae bacterium]
MIGDKPLHTFLDDLAGDAPTPGGGSAAALSGAMGAALVSMVCSLTVGRKKYADVEAQMKTIRQKSEDLRRSLTGLISADAEAFNGVMAAFGLPRQTEAEKAARSEAIQSALKKAALVPLACARACRQVIELSKPVAEQGNPNVASDAGVAVLAAYAGLRGAALNVYINLGSIKDGTFVREKQAELDEILAGADALAEEVHELVKSRL